MPHRKDLADALLEEHAVRPEALARAQKEHERSGRPLWGVVLDLGLCTEDGIFRVLLRHGGVAAIPEERLRGLLVPADLRAVVSQDMAAELGMVPLERSTDGKRVALAMVDPMAELAPVRAAMGRLGVVEIHRFLVHRGALRRFLVPLYADTAPTELPPARPQDRLPESIKSPRPQDPLPLSDRPTGIVTLPEHSAATPAERKRKRGDEKTQRQDEKTQRIPGRERPSLKDHLKDRREPMRAPDRGDRGEVPLLSPPVVPFPRPQAITQPLSPVSPEKPTTAERPSTVHIDPELAAEIEMLSVGVAQGGEGRPGAASGPAAPPPLPPGQSSREAQATQVTKAPRPSPPAAPPPSPQRGSAASPAAAAKAETRADGVTRVDRPSPVPAAPVPPAALPSAVAPATAPATVPSEPPAEQPLTQQPLTLCLLLIVEALVRELEKHVAWRGTSGLPSAIELSQLSERVARQAGLSPRQAEEVGLLGLLYGIERLLLLERGPLPPGLEGELGFSGQMASGLGACLHNLQGVLHGLEQGRDRGTRSALSLGKRLIPAAALALDLLRSGLAPEALPPLLRERAGSPEGLEFLLQVLAAQRGEPSAVWQAPPPSPSPGPGAAGAPGGHPGPPGNSHDTDRSLRTPMGRQPAGPSPHRTLPDYIDPDVTHELTIPEPHDALVDSPSDPEIEIEMAEVSDTGLETYQPVLIEES